MTDTSLNGIYPAIVTPLTPAGELANGVAEKLLARLLSAGVDGVYATVVQPMLSPSSETTPIRLAVSVVMFSLRQAN